VAGKWFGIPEKVPHSGAKLFGTFYFLEHPGNNRIFWGRREIKHQSFFLPDQMFEMLGGHGLAFADGFIVGATARAVDPFGQPFRPTGV
jgi:hypothetical protein